MSDELKLRRDEQRGIKARQILNDELVIKAFEDIKQMLYHKIEQSSFEQKEVREDCYRMLRASECFEGMFKRHINTGRAAEEKLSLMKRVVKRIQEL